MVELRNPHTNQSQLLVLRDLAIALSACIYQSLCDSDTFKAAIQESQVSCVIRLTEMSSLRCKKIFNCEIYVSTGYHFYIPRGTKTENLCK